MKLTGDNRSTREKPVPVPLCPPQIPHGLNPGSNPGLRGGMPSTNSLSHGTALHQSLNSNAGLVLSFKPQPLLSTCPSISYAVIILPFKAHTPSY
jgi:hypothetical protein